MFRTITLSWFVIFSVGFAFAEEPDPSEEEINQLIADLVSPNVAPVRKGPRAVYPEGFDRGAQGKVFRAFRKLHALGPKAFPYLFDHFDDKRYSLTGDGGEAEVNKSVGQLCVHIVVSHIQPYAGSANPGARFYQRRPDAPNYFHHFKLRDPISAREWWQTHQDKSLRELQIEVLEWVIAEEDKIPEKYNEVDRDKLRTKLDNLQKSDQPLKPSWPFAR